MDLSNLWLKIIQASTFREIRFFIFYDTLIDRISYFLSHVKNQDKPIIWLVISSWSQKDNIVSLDIIICFSLQELVFIRPWTIWDQSDIWSNSKSELMAYPWLNRERDLILSFIVMVEFIHHIMWYLVYIEE